MGVAEGAVVGTIVGAVEGTIVGVVVVYTGVPNCQYKPDGFGPPPKLVTVIVSTNELL